MILDTEVLVSLGFLLFFFFFALCFIACKYKTQIKLNDITKSPPGKIGVRWRPSPILTQVLFSRAQVGGSRLCRAINSRNKKCELNI